MAEQHDEKFFFVLAHDEARRRAHLAIDQAPAGFVVTIEEATRTLEQNAAQWPILTAFSKQVQWMVNGEKVYMSPDEWKDVLSAAFDNETVRAALGFNGGIVMLGKRTSKFGKKRFSDWLEFLNYAAAERGVNLENQDNARAHYE